MFKYTPAKKIVKQLLHISRNPMNYAKKFEFARSIFPAECAAMVQSYEQFTAFYSAALVDYVLIQGVRFPVKFFDVEEVA